MKEKERLKIIKSKAILKEIKLKDLYIHFGYTSYEGFKMAILENRRNRYYETLEYLESI